MAKDRKQRLDSAADARLEIEDGATGDSAISASGVRASGGVPARSPALRWMVSASAVALLLLAAIGATWAIMRQSSANSTVLRYTIGPPPGYRFSPSSFPVVSQDGRRIAFVAVDNAGQNTLWVRSLDALAATPVAGTDGALQPFWAPDGSALGFFADGRLKKVALSGGPRRLSVMRHNRKAVPGAPTASSFLAACGDRCFVWSQPAGRRPGSPPLVTTGEK